MKKLLKCFAAALMTAVITVTGASQCFASDDNTIDVVGGTISYMRYDITGTPGAYFRRTKIQSATKGTKAVLYKNISVLSSTLFFTNFAGIDTCAFLDCKELAYVNLYDLGGSIDAYAFENCTALEKIILWGDYNISDYSFSGCDKNKLVFYCQKGSNVEEFAKNQGFKYVALEEGSLKYGDVNLDGVVNTEDASLLIQYVIGNAEESDKYMIEDRFGYSDVNRDGVIDSADVAEIVQKSLDSGYLMPCER